MVKNGSNRISKIKTFLGSKDFEISRKFYRDLGFEELFSNGQLSEFVLGQAGFFLQNYYQKEWCQNSMLYLNVESAAYWYECAKNVIEDGDFAVARVKEPKHQSYGDLVTFVWDPVGILLHFAETSKNS